MTTAQWIEMGNRDWQAFRAMAEAEGYGFEFETLKGRNVIVFYIGASDGKSTWVVEEPLTRMGVASMSRMAAFSPLYKAEQDTAKAAKAKAEKEAEDADWEAGPEIVALSAESLAKYGSMLEGRSSWKSLNEIPSNILRVYALPNGTFVKA